MESKKEMIEQFVKDRDAAFRSLDMYTIVKYMAKYRMPFPSSELVFWAMIHKARLDITTFTVDEKIESCQWLMEHGFKQDLTDTPLETVLAGLLERRDAGDDQPEKMC